MTHSVVTSAPSLELLPTSIVASFRADGFSRGGERGSSPCGCWSPAPTSRNGNDDAAADRQLHLHAVRDECLDDLPVNPQKTICPTCRDEAGTGNQLFIHGL